MCVALLYSYNGFKNWWLSPLDDLLTIVGSKCFGLGFVYKFCKNLWNRDGGRVTFDPLRSESVGGW